MITIVDVLTVVPMAVVMIAGPQILSAIFLALSGDWRRNSVAFLLGASLSVPVVVTIAYVSGIGAIGGGARSDTVHAIVLIVLLVAMGYVYRTRATSSPPAWMGTLETIDSRGAFRFGFLLMGFFPTDLLTSIAVGSSLAAHGEPLWHAVGFVSLTLFLLATPALTLLVFGDRGEATLPKIRTWIDDHSWLVTEAVLLFFVASTGSSLVG